MSWHFVERWLQKVYQHSTLIGKFWITFLIVFRIVVVSSVSDRVYSDEQSEFRCNTGQVGCGNVCFNQFSPISHIRFWSFQIIMVSTPTILFMVYSAHKVKVNADKKAEKGKKNAKGREDARRPSYYPDAAQLQQRRASAARPGLFSSPSRAILGKNPDMPPATPAGSPDPKKKDPISNLQGQSVVQPQPDLPPPKPTNSKASDDEKQSFMHHFVLYTLSVIARTVIELLFICIQYWLFGWQVNTLYKCVGHPCPNTVDCYISRPGEKTVIMWFMYGVAAISTLMNLIELNYLLSHWVSTRLQALRDRRIAMKRSMAMNTNSGGPRETLANGNLMNRSPQQLNWQKNNQNNNNSESPNQPLLSNYDKLKTSDTKDQVQSNSSNYLGYKTNLRFQTNNTNSGDGTPNTPRQKPITEKPPAGAAVVNTLNQQATSSSNNLYPTASHNKISYKSNYKQNDYI